MESKDARKAYRSALEKVTCDSVSPASICFSCKTFRKLPLTKEQCMEKQRDSIRMGQPSQGNNGKRTLMALRRNSCSKTKARLEKAKPSSHPS